jgi:hypothetical protein
MCVPYLTEAAPAGGGGGRPESQEGQGEKEGQERQEGGKEEAENGLVISCSGELNQTPVLKK